MSRGKGSKGCGLWMTPRAPWSNRRLLSPRPGGGEGTSGDEARHDRAALGTHTTPVPSASSHGPQPVPALHHRIRRRPEWSDQAEPARIF